MKLKPLLPQPRVLCLASLLLISIRDSLVHAWGKEGHEMVADIAYRRLSDQSKDVIANILFPKGSDYDYDKSKYASPMAAVSTWADAVRYEAGKGLAWTEPMHFVDVRDDLIPGGCHYTPTESETETLASIDTGSSCYFDYDRDCSNGVCVVHAIQQFTDKLYQDIKTENSATHPSQLMTSLRGSQQQPAKSNTKESLPPPPTSPYSQFNTRESLMFLIHFIGDIHQPLHISRKSDVGGNTIHVSFPKPYHFQYSHIRSELLFSSIAAENEYYPSSSVPLIHHKGWNLHSVWDSGMIEYIIDEKYERSQSKYQSYIEKTYLSDDNGNDKWDWNQCTDTTNQTCISIWAEESWDDAIEYAYDDEKGHEIQSGDDLTRDYIMTRLPIVERRIAAAGVRLASTLEMIYSGKFQLQQHGEKDENVVENISHNAATTTSTIAIS